MTHELSLEKLQLYYFLARDHESEMVDFESKLTAKRLGEVLAALIFKKPG